MTNTYPTGDAIFDDAISVVLRIPRSQQNWVMAVFEGLLNSMCYTSSWFEAGESTPDDAVSTYTAILASLQVSYFAIGDVKWSAAPSLPTGSGWLGCNGQIVAQTDWPELFTVLGTLYNTGGEGSGNFRLPDYSGRLLAGPDGSSLRLGTAWANTLGGSGGESSHQLITSEIPSHVHGGIPTFIDTAAGLEPALASVQVPLITTNTSATGGDGSHNNIQPTIIQYPYILARL